LDFPTIVIIWGFILFISQSHNFLNKIRGICCCYPVIFVMAIPNKAGNIDYKNSIHTPKVKFDIKHSFKSKHPSTGMSYFYI
jgi:hypothetical protein